MKILLFGKNGQVGWELNRSLQPLGEVIALGRESANFSKPESLRQIVQEVSPDIIVNAVAYTAVDKAEEDESLALDINAISPGVLAEEALKLNALLVHYSTDYVFDGTKESAYEEKDKPNPINAYGRTKLAGEQAVQASGCRHLIFRTSWVYSLRGRNFLLSMMNLLQEKDRLNVVSDQIGSPTSAKLIADISCECLCRILGVDAGKSKPYGIYNLVPKGSVSWYGFTQVIADNLSGTGGCKISPITSDEYQCAAPRPKNSRLNVNKIESIFFVKLPGWKDALLSCLPDDEKS